MSGGFPLGGSSGSSPLTTKGDLYTYSTMDTRLPVGTNGQALVADSAETTGLKWATVGDVVGPGSSTDNAIVRFDGTTGKLLQNSAVTIDDTSGAMTFTAASGANILWTTDGAGRIGGGAANRPNEIYLKTTANVGQTSDTAGSGGGVTLKKSGGGFGGQIVIHPSNSSGNGIILTLEQPKCFWIEDSAGTEQFRLGVTSGEQNAFRLMGSSGAHISWATDGAGDIGESAARRPNNLYVKTNARIGGSLGIGNSAAATVAVGTLANKFEIFTAAGVSLGFVPVYDSIT